MANHRDRRRATQGRRRFLRLLGGGAAGAGVGAWAVRPAPAGAATSGFALDLRADLGAVGDGVTDDAPVIQQAFADLAAEAGTGDGKSGVAGAYIEVPPGAYRLGSTVRIHRFAGIVQGAGVGMSPDVGGAFRPGAGSVFRWDGPPGQPMFEITDSRSLSLRDLRFSGNDDRPPSAGLRFLKNDRRHTQGTNGHLSVSDCHLGTWPWRLGGNSGRLDAGVEFAGRMGDNDQYWFSRCTFAGSHRDGTVGFRAESSQSIWGSFSDCLFHDHEIGFDSPASSTLVNPQFNRCRTDVRLRSTARLDVLGWQSEGSWRLAELAPWSRLNVNGGVCVLNPERMTPGSALIDAYPSSGGQSISLRDMTITARPGAYGPGERPDVRFGPGGSSHATGAGFFVRVDNCTGLRADQCTLVEPVAIGDSRGTVEWHSRDGNPGIHQFRNELRGSGIPGSRRTLDRGTWDPPIPGTS